MQLHMVELAPIRPFRSRASKTSPIKFALFLHFGAEVGFQITGSSLDGSSLLGRATNRHSHTHPTHTHHDSRLTLHSLFVAISHRASSNTHTGGPVIPVHYHVTHQLVHRGSSHVCTAVQTLNQPTTIPTTTRKYPPPSSPSSSALAAWPHGAERRSHHYAP